MATDEIAKLLHQAADRHAQRLRRELQDTFMTLDLTPEEVSYAHEHFNSDNPSTAEFESKNSTIRSALLAKQAITQMTEAKDRFLTEIEEMFQSYHWDNSEPLSEGQRISRELFASGLTIDESFNAAVAKIFTRSPGEASLKRIGLHWNHMLTKEATRRSLDELYNLEAEADASNRLQGLIYKHEASLLFVDPWAYTHQLLNAFEKSHQKITKHAQNIREELTHHFNSIANNEQLAS